MQFQLIIAPKKADLNSRAEDNILMIQTELRIGVMVTHLILDQAF
jgi:hypothetical protein